MDEDTITMSIEAARNALARAGIPATELGGMDRSDLIRMQSNRADLCGGSYRCGCLCFGCGFRICCKAAPKR